MRKIRLTRIEAKSIMIGHIWKKVPVGRKEECYYEQNDISA